jgi:transcriptional regulator with XRE-family HTH domain
MVNIDDFIKRLEIILDYYGLSASSFADKVGVQRSSLSHLLSGRNKPSLDLILKIVQNFPEVDLYWILNGKGVFPKSDDKGLSEIVSTSQNLKIEDKMDDRQKQPNLFTDNTTTPKNPIFEKKTEIFSNTGNLEEYKNSAEIERIVIFYKNGTFKNFLPE